jgi:hypothetical protein
MAGDAERAYRASRCSSLRRRSILDATLWLRSVEETVVVGAIGRGGAECARRIAVTGADGASGEGLRLGLVLGCCGGEVED